jgi:hypothetical protein
MTETVTSVIKSQAKKNFDYLQHMFNKSNDILIIYIEVFMDHTEKKKRYTRFLCIIKMNIDISQTKLYLIVMNGKKIDNKG